MTQPFFTVLLPINRSPELLPFAVQTVLEQRGVEFELFITCDGAPDATVACANELAEQHRQIRVFAFEKGERHGEAHRDVALREARAPFVAQIGDDDLWLPDYLATLGNLLAWADFGNLLQTELLPDGSMYVHVDDLSDEVTRRRMCSEPWNFFGPSVAGYRLSAYRSLPVGWSPAPADLWTDLHMWRKFLQQDSLTFGTAFSVQCLKLSAHHRQSIQTGERALENAPIARLIADPHERLIYQERAMRAIWQQLNGRYLQADAERSELRLATVHLRATEERLRHENSCMAQRHDDVTAQLAADFALEKERLQHEVAHLERLHHEVLSTLTELRSSRSWTITAPLRWIESRWRRSTTK
ncbi:glycosyltransferase [Ensifer sp. 2YAB10]|uniref:glycosyltransferase family 2 protein n=1 Tax=unclassified Ensifer TaxID=2633371 RepID=UPI003F9271E2